MDDRLCPSDGGRVRGDSCSYIYMALPGRPGLVGWRRRDPGGKPVLRQNVVRLSDSRGTIRSAAKRLSLAGDRATAIFRPVALDGHTGFARRTRDGQAELDLRSTFDGSRDRRCGTTPPGGCSDDAGHRLRESPRSFPPRSARWTWRPARPCRARDECDSGDSTRSSGLGCGAGIFRRERERDSDTRAGSNR